MVVMGSIKQLLPLCLEVYQLFLQDGLPTKNTSLSQGTLAAHIVQDEAQLGFWMMLKHQLTLEGGILELKSWNPFGPGVPHPTIFRLAKQIPLPPHGFFWKEPKVFPRISEMVSQIHRLFKISGHKTWDVGPILGVTWRCYIKIY